MRANRSVLFVGLAVAAIAAIGGVFVASQRFAPSRVSDFVRGCTETCIASRADPEFCSAYCDCMAENSSDDLDKIFAAHSDGKPPDPELQRRVAASQQRCVAEVTGSQAGR